MGFPVIDASTAERAPLPAPIHGKLVGLSRGFGCDLFLPFSRLAVNYIYVSLQTIAVALHAWLLRKINLDINYLTFVLLAD